LSVLAAVEFCPKKSIKDRDEVFSVLNPLVGEQFAAEETLEIFEFPSRLSLMLSCCFTGKLAELSDKRNSNFERGSDGEWVS